MVHTIALETGEWEVEAEAAEVFLVLRLEIDIHKFTLESGVSSNIPEFKLAFLKRLDITQPNTVYVLYI